MEPGSEKPPIEEMPGDPNAPQEIGPDDEGIGNIRPDRSPVMPAPTDSDPGSDPAGPGTGEAFPAPD